MTTYLDRPTLPTDRPSRRRRHRTWLVVGAALAVGLIAATLVVRHVRDLDLHRDYLGSDGWPSQGQAAYRAGTSEKIGPDQSRVPIASLAKVMTAYVVLHTEPLHGAAQGPALSVSVADVRDYDRRKADGESVIAVRHGERLTERQALAAILLPSANNVAVMLARSVAGGVPEFVARMNAEARRLGMAQTYYTDPSGLDRGTVSTARDQLKLAVALSHDEVFSELVSLPSYRLPVAGTVRSTDALLGRDGFVGTKTGSDDAAGGCFMFRTSRVVHGRVTDVLGVVLGQHGRHDITAGLYAARQLAARIGSPAGG